MSNWRPATSPCKSRAGLFDTGLSKFGALLGDHSEVGCNAVLNPGSIIGPGRRHLPNANWRGFLPANRIAKNQAAIQVGHPGTLRHGAKGP